MAHRRSAWETWATSVSGCPGPISASPPTRPNASSTTKWAIRLPTLTGPSYILHADDKDGKPFLFDTELAAMADLLDDYQHACAVFDEDEEKDYTNAFQGLTGDESPEEVTVTETEIRSVLADAAIWKPPKGSSEQELRPADQRCRSLGRGSAAQDGERPRCHRRAAE